MNTPKYSWIILLILVASGMVNQVDKIIIGLVSVPVMKELHLSPSQWGVVGSSFFWFFTISSFVLGGLADSRNTKKMFTWIMLVWLVVQFTTPLVSSVSLLMFSRMVLGAGEGPAISISTSIIGKWFPKHRHGIGFGAVLFGATIGPAIASPILISLINKHGWRAAFVAMGTVGFIVLLLWMFFGKESPKDIGMPTYEQQDQNTVIPNKVSWKQFFPHIFSKNFMFTVICAGCAYWLLSVQSVWFPAYFSKIQHFEGKTLKLAVSLPFLFAAICQIGVALISDRIYRKTGDIRRSRINLAGSSMVLSGICLYIGSIADSSGIAIFCFILAPGFAIVILSLAPAMLMEFFSPKNIGKAQGTYVALSSSTSIIAPVIFGNFIEKSASEAIGYGYGFLITALVMFVFGLLFWITVRPAKQTNATVNIGEQVI
ncbi:MFS transporter [Bacillus sp. AFS017336]|uniref:MFS transporter n=1 Tax=Bacillus sp. AFS017336 TaxID=2033489 RepID=UPI000BEFBE07|nr:MFS transporter [Bacillus sp. AFS017336]PEL14052.1 MFS transporter [Bacillus sp. AFS017336]